MKLSSCGYSEMRTIILFRTTRYRAVKPDTLCCCHFVQSNCFLLIIEINFSVSTTPICCTRQLIPLLTFQSLNKIYWVFYHNPICFIFQQSDIRCQKAITTSNDRTSNMNCILFLYFGFYLLSFLGYLAKLMSFFGRIFYSNQ